MCVCVLTGVSVILICVECCIDMLRFFFVGFLSPLLIFQLRILPCTQAISFLKGRMTGTDVLQCYARSDPQQPLTDDQTGKILEQLNQYYAHVVAYNEKLEQVCVCVCMCVCVCACVC